METPVNPLRGIIWCTAFDTQRIQLRSSICFVTLLSAEPTEQGHHFGANCEAGKSYGHHSKILLRKDVLGGRT
jgi:hypothetical protein